MIQRHYLVIGAGAAGDAVCEGIRRYDKKGSIMLVSAEAAEPYDRSQLSKHFLAVAKPKIDSIAMRPEGHYEKQKIDLRCGTAVTQINTERRIATLSTGQAVQFEKACLAMGSRARRPMVAGTNLGNVFYLRSLSDALALHEVAHLVKEPAVIGGGLLGAEVAALLAALKCKVTLFDRNETLWHQRVDPETAHWLTEYFTNHGVRMLMREGLNGFEGKTVLRNIQTKGGTRHPAGMAVVAIGSEPNLELVANTPLSSPFGTPVNELLETEEKGVYAAGDIAYYPDKLFGGMRRVEHWHSAREQGLLVGANMTGKKRQRYAVVPRYATKLFDLDFRFIGDFSLPPMRTVLEGDRQKKSFIAKYYSGDKLKAALLCNRKDSETKLTTLEEEIRKTHA